MIDLELLMELEIGVKVRQIGAGPYGRRQLLEITGGEFQGTKITGRVLPSGGDWMLMGADGVARLDVRMMLETEDGTPIYMQFSGMLEVNDRVTAAWNGSHESDYDDAYFFAQPRFETGDPRYAWLNRIVCLAEGKVGPNKVTYRVYRTVKG
jgi:hypothetical protein